MSDDPSFRSSLGGLSLQLSSGDEWYAITIPNPQNEKEDNTDEEEDDEDQDDDDEDKEDKDKEE